MKATIYMMAIIVAAYVYDQGYPYVAFFLLVVASWEAFIDQWHSAFRKHWRREWSSYKENFAAELKRENRWLGALGVAGMIAFFPIWLVITFFGSFFASRMHENAQLIHSLIQKGIPDAEVASDQSGSIYRFGVKHGDQVSLLYVDRVFLDDHSPLEITNLFSTYKVTEALLAERKSQKLYFDGVQLVDYWG